jgi:hypothetical protein
MKPAKPLSLVVISSCLLASLAMPFFAGCKSQVEVDPESSDPGSSDPGSSDPEFSDPGFSDPDGPPDQDVPVITHTDCHVRLVKELSGPQELTLSNQDLTASGHWSMGLARASASHITGKWYFETRIDAMPGGVWWGQDIGVAVPEVMMHSCDKVGLGAEYNKTGTICSDISSFGGGATEYGAGDVVGVAMNLYTGRIYFAKNGVWANGDPTSGKAGAKLLTVPGTGTFYPYISVSENDIMTVNFGESAFAYGPPAGYSAYAAGLTPDASGDCVDLGPEGVPADPAPMTASCDDFSSYGSSPLGDPELHVIGVYESVSGAIDVKVTRKEPMVLALSSYDPIQWNVTLEPGAQVKKIIMASYEVSSVSAPAGIPIDTFIFEKGGELLGCAIKWPNAPGGCDTQILVKNVEGVAGLALTSFGGCYAGSTFALTD